MDLIKILEQEEIARLTGDKVIPDFRAGDTVVVNVNVVEGSRKRVQAFEGVVIARRNRGLNSTAVSTPPSSFARSPRVKAWNVRSSSTPRRLPASK